MPAHATTSPPADWFQQLTGFAETDYTSTQARLLAQLQDERFLRLPAGAAGEPGGGRLLDMGRFELMSLGALRAALAQAGPARGPANTLTGRVGEAGALHTAPDVAGAVVQVASQFNMLEMTSPQRRPEDGVSAYVYDRTQGPACALAAAGGTIWRNYLVPVPTKAGSSRGQREHQQLNGLAGLTQAVAQGLGVAQPWAMRNGYALFAPGQVQAASAWVAAQDAAQRDALRALLAVGVHWDVDVTALRRPWPARLPQVTQVYGSALPVAYNPAAGASLADWAPLAGLVLEAAYEATLCVAALNARRGGTPRLLLTLLGGGVFGNPPAWVLAAVGRALQAVPHEGLAVELVSYGAPSAEVRAFLAGHAALTPAPAAAPPR